MTAPSKAEVLRLAAQIVETNGLHQGWFVDDDQVRTGLDLSTCRVCAMGAINLALGLRPDASSHMTSDLATLLGRTLGLVPQPLEGMPGSITMWNDMDGRGADEVRDALLEAAAVAAEGGAS